VIFLASQASQYVCGELLVVDGVSALLLLLFISVLMSLDLVRDGWAVKLHLFYSCFSHIYMLCSRKFVRLAISVREAI
jgi:hypothetical protein